MSKVFQNRAFKYGMILGLSISLLAQLIYLIHIFLVIGFNSQPEISVHYFWEIGFPFPMFYGWYGFLNGHFSLAAFIGNTLLAIIFSLVVGSIFKFVWSKISLCRTELK